MNSYFAKDENDLLYIINTDKNTFIINVKYLVLDTSLTKHYKEYLDNSCSSMFNDRIIIPIDIYEIARNLINMKILY